MLTVHEVALPS